jgi:hypothetical protein
MVQFGAKKVFLLQLCLKLNNLLLKFTDLDTVLFFELCSILNHILSEGLTSCLELLNL